MKTQLYRAQPGQVELRDDTEDAMPVLTGHFATFNDWTEINSYVEGNFMERIAPGAFTKTFQEGRSGMRVLFQHGHDPTVGDKPLGPIRTLAEDEIGARYEVPMLDTSYNAEILPGLREGLYGASFRFQVQREDFAKEPGESDHNPSGLPERTIKEARVMEFGPVTFPAYASATAGVRSLTDEFNLSALLRDPERLRELLEFVHGRETAKDEDAPAEGAEPEAHPQPARREYESNPLEFGQRLGLIKPKEGHWWLQHH